MVESTVRPGTFCEEYVTYVTRGNVHDSCVQRPIMSVVKRWGLHNIHHMPPLRTFGDCRPVVAVFAGDRVCFEDENARDGPPDRVISTQLAL